MAEARGVHPEYVAKFRTKPGEAVVRCLDCGYDLSVVPSTNESQTCPECAFVNPMVGLAERPAPAFGREVLRALGVTAGFLFIALVAGVLGPSRASVLTDALERASGARSICSNLHSDSPVDLAPALDVFKDAARTWPLRRAVLMFGLMVSSQMLLFVVETFVLWGVEQVLR